MNVKQIIERLEEIYQDLPMEAMRQSRELGELIDELKESERRFYICIVQGDYLLYWFEEGWTSYFPAAVTYPKKKGEEVLERIHLVRPEAILKEWNV